MARETALAASAYQTPPVRRNQQKLSNSHTLKLLRGSAKLEEIGTATGQSRDDNTLANRNRAWQQQAWQYYRSVGELRYAARFIGACLSRCRLIIGLPDSDGNPGPVFDENGDVITDSDGNALEGTDGAKQAQEILRSLRNPVTGQSQLLARTGINLAIAGEFHLVGSAPDGTDVENISDPSQLEWEILSTREFYKQGKNYLRIRGEGITPDEIPEQNVQAVRCWRADPEFVDQPDGMVRAVFDVLEELVLLTRGIRGETLNRLSNGNLLLVPSEIEWPNDDGDDGSGDSGDPFTRDLVLKMSTAITDKGSAAQTVPFVIRAPMELLGGIKNIDLSPKNTDKDQNKRTEAVQRLAQGIDLPVEIVTGHAGTTFSNAVQIDDSLFKSHIEPLLDEICDSFTVGFLRAALSAFGIKDSPLVVYYDSTELVARPNRAQDAKDAWDRFVISNSTLRQSLGFSDTDAPDDDELEKRVRIKQLVLMRSAVATTPQGLEAEDKGIQDPTGEPNVADLPPVGADGKPIQQGPGAAGNNTDSSLAASINAMAELAVEQSVSRAGGRLRSECDKRNASVRHQLKQVASADVPKTLGPSLVQKFSGGEDALLFGQFDVLWGLAYQRTQNKQYADALRTACIAIARSRMYERSTKFPTEQLPQLSKAS